VQGRTYAYLVGLIERCINAKVLELGRAHCFGDQIAYVGHPSVGQASA
jgi:hypothetical protein